MTKTKTYINPRGFTAQQIQLAVAKLLNLHRPIEDEDNLPAVNVIKYLLLCCCYYFCVHRVQKN